MVEFIELTTNESNQRQKNLSENFYFENNRKNRRNAPLDNVSKNDNPEILVSAYIDKRSIAGEWIAS